MTSNPWSDPLAEAAICSGILVQPELMDRINLSEEDFSAWKPTFKALSELHVDRIPIALETLRHKLSEEHLRGLMGENPVTGQAAMHVAGELRKLTRRRQAHEILKNAAETVANERDFDNAQPTIEAALMSILSDTAKRESKPWKALLQGALDRIEANLERGFGLRGVTSGLPSLDEMTGGFVGGELIVIGGATGGGKSALGLQMALRASSREQAGLVYSLEMSGEELVDRVIAGESRVSLSSVRFMPLNEGQLNQITSGVARISNGPAMIVEDSSDLNILQLRSNARRHAAQRKLAIIIVDYCQLITGTGRFDGSNREREVAEVSRNLKQMAKELNVPVVLLSQLNDEGRLRESRAIGQDADIVLKISPVGETEDQRNLEIVKHRNGPRGNILLKFHGDTTTFSELKLKA